MNHSMFSRDRGRKFVIFSDYPTEEYRVIFDFEEAEKNGFINAWKTLFTNTNNLKVSGCLFHYAQAIYRWYQKNTTSKQKEDIVGKKLLSFFLWLPHIDATLIKELVVPLKGKITGFENFICYFMNYWMQGRFPLWAGQTDYRTSTNGALENFHGRLNERIFKSFGIHSKPPIDILSNVLIGMDMEALVDLKDNIIKGKMAPEKAGLRTILGRTNREKVQERLLSFVTDLKNSESLNPEEIRKAIHQEEWDRVRCKEDVVEGELWHIFLISEVQLPDQVQRVEGKE
jgi:hypothetical protein